MGSEMNMVPSLCTQCGGTVEVDKNMETAKCPFCGTTFMIEKAVNNYNVKYARIDHADNVNIDVGDAVKDVLGFVGEQMKEGRQERREQRIEQAERNKKMDKAFLKIFAIMFGGMMAFAMIAFIVMRFTGKFDDDPTETKDTGNAVIECDIDDGCLYTDVTGRNVAIWCYQEYDSSGTELKYEENDEDGYHSCVGAGDTEEGARYVVAAAWGEDFEEADAPLYYSVIRVNIIDNEIVSASDPVIVDSLSEYDFK